MAFAHVHKIGQKMYTYTQKKKMYLRRHSTFDEVEHYRWNTMQVKFCCTEADKREIHQ